MKLHIEPIEASTYSIYFEENGYEELNELIVRKGYSKIFILVDENTMNYCYSKFIQFLDTKLPTETIEIKSGEEHKNIETCNDVWFALTQHEADRKSLMINLGGGVITDIGGFVASTYKRGIDFVNIPTTLLSMVDASVGGKTGIDQGILKNHIGLFADPQIVIIDISFLDTLNDREIRSGMAEIIKYGMTSSIELLNEVINYKDLKYNYLIHESIVIKNQIVLKDPKENSLRKILNFGHTLGHAIESFYLDSNLKKPLNHGEAIAIGMVCETYISSKLLNFQEGKLQEIKEFICSIFGKDQIDPKNFMDIINLLKYDKKNTNGQVNFVLLHDIESYKLDCKVSEDLIIESFNYYNA